MSRSVLPQSPLCINIQNFHFRGDVLVFFNNDASYFSNKLLFDFEQVKLEKYNNIRNSCSYINVISRIYHRSHSAFQLHRPAFRLPARREDQRRDSGIRGAGMIYVNRSHEKA